MTHTNEALARKVEQLEAFRAEVQAICESGRHRTMHTQAQICVFLDGIRFKAMKAKIGQQDETDNAAALALEDEGWSEIPGFVPWAEGGNSVMQDEAHIDDQALGPFIKDRLATKTLPDGKVKKGVSNRTVCKSTMRSRGSLILCVRN